MKVSERGFIPVASRCAPACAYLRSATSPHHRRWRTRPCTRARWLVEVAAGQKRLDARVIPSVAYTIRRSPGSASLRPRRALRDGLQEVGAFPWVANGARCPGREDGFTKPLPDPRVTACSAAASSAPTPAISSARWRWRSRPPRRRRYRAHDPSAPDAVGDRGGAAEAFEGTPLTDLYIPGNNPAAAPSALRALGAHNTRAALRLT